MHRIVRRMLAIASATMFASSASFDDPAGIGWLLTLLADDSNKTRGLELAAVHAAEALDVGRRAGVLQVVAGAQRELAVVAKNRGDHAEAERLLQHAVRLYEDAGDRWQLTATLRVVAGVYADRGDFERAFAVTRDSLRIARDVGSSERLLYELVGCVTVLWRAGAAVEAAALVEALERATETLPQFRAWLRRQPVVASLRRPAEDGGRVRGAEQSLDAATDSALRILEDRLAATQGTHGGSEDAIASRLAHDAFRRDGDFWTIAFAGKEVRLRDLRGLHYLATLLREPGREFHATDLVRSGRGPASAPSVGEDIGVSLGLGDAGERLDARARSAYRARLGELEGELADAERCNDRGRAERAHAEREALVAELTAAARGHRAVSDGERARITVTKAIKTALEKIAASHPELGAHLHSTVRRGYFCSYVPDPRHPIEWET